MLVEGVPAHRTFYVERNGQRTSRRPLAVNRAEPCGKRKQTNRLFCEGTLRQTGIKEAAGGTAVVGASISLNAR